MTGIDNVLKAIPLEVKFGKQKVIGILVDTDDDAERCWYTTAQALEKADLQGKAELPERLDPEGTITYENYQAGVPRIGIWIMPIMDILALSSPYWTENLFPCHQGGHHCCALFLSIWRLHDTRLQQEKALSVRE